MDKDYEDQRNDLIKNTKEVVYILVDNEYKRKAKIKQCL